MSQDARSSGVGGRGRNEPGGDSAGSDSSQRNEAVALSAAAVGHNGTNLMSSPEYLAAYELEVWKRGERLGNWLWSFAAASEADEGSELKAVSCFESKQDSQLHLGAPFFQVVVKVPLS